MNATELVSLVQTVQGAAMGVAALVKSLRHSDAPPVHPDGTPLTDADVDAAVAAAKAPWLEIEQVAREELAKTAPSTDPVSPR